MLSYKNKEKPPTLTAKRSSLIGEIRGSAGMMGITFPADEFGADLPALLPSYDFAALSVSPFMP